MADENGADALDDATDTGATDTTQAGDDAQQPEKSFDVEDFAGSMGWAPKDQWRGDPDAWKPAEDFVRGTVSVNQSLSKKLKNLERNTQRIIQANEQHSRRSALLKCPMRSWKRSSTRRLTRATRPPSSTSRPGLRSSIARPRLPILTLPILSNAIPTGSTSIRKPPPLQWVWPTTCTGRARPQPNRSRRRKRR
jgi:hypothetical protein